MTPLRASASLLVLAWCVLGGFVSGEAAAGAPPSPSFPRTSPAVPARAYPEPSLGNVAPVRASAPVGRVYPSGQAIQGDTVWVFLDSLETRSSPSNEGGWTHQDASFQPAAWHIDTLSACQGHAFWCGRVDSSWVNDANRRGYDNSWTQMLSNFVNLTGAVSPVKISFKHQLEAESGFDYGTLEVLDLDAGWLPLRTWTGSIHGPSAAPQQHHDLSTGGLEEALPERCDAHPVLPDRHTKLCVRAQQVKETLELLTIYIPGSAVHERRLSGIIACVRSICTLTGEFYARL